MESNGVMQTVLKHETVNPEEALLIRVIQKENVLPQVVEEYVAKINELSKKGLADIKEISIGENNFYMIFDYTPVTNGSWALDEALEGLELGGKYDGLFLTQKDLN